MGLKFMICSDIGFVSHILSSPTVIRADGRDVGCKVLSWYSTKMVYRGTGDTDPSLEMFIYDINTAG